MSDSKSETSLDKAILVAVNINSQNTLDNAKKNTISDVLETASKLLYSGGKKEGTSSGSFAKKTLGNDFKIMEVQYNPSKLNLSTSAGDTPLENPQAGGQMGIITEISRPPETYLDLELFVEGENTRVKINGFLGMMSSELTRRVIFYWGNMCFPGEVVHVSAKYSMFSPEGRPIMGTVSLKIRQEVSGGKEYEYWIKAFDKLFEKRKNELLHSGKVKE